MKGPAKPAAGARAGTADTDPPTRAVSAERDRKFRQAAFVYLHVAVLYEAAAFAMIQNGVLPTGRLGSPWLWLLIGGLVAIVVFWGLLRWRNPWFPRVVWALHSLRLPALISGAFLRGQDGMIAPSFYLTAIVVVVINLAFLARAGWDL